MHLQCDLLVSKKRFVNFGAGRGNLPRPIGVHRGKFVRRFFNGEHLPVAKTSQEKTAIAFYREGVSLDNPFYAFLSLYKVISVIHPKMKVTWCVGRRCSK